MGLRRPRAQEKLRSLINQFQPSVVFIAEPKINCNAAFCNKLNLSGMQNMVIHNSLFNKKGNIWLFWNKNLPTPTVVSMSTLMITVNIGGNLVYGVHAHVGVVQRRNLWTEMEVISRFNLPWLAIGDFNAFLTAEENFGGRAPNTRNMLEFNNCLDKCELQQASKSLCWNYKVGLRIASDHSPLLDGCVEGDPTFVFQSKLKKLKKGLVEWNWKVFVNLNEQIKEATKEVQEAMKLSDDNPLNEELLDNLVKAENKLNTKEVQLSTMLKLKARTKWVKEGSANTNFFHTKLKVRQARNSIYELENSNNEIIIDQGKITEELVKFFEERFKFKEVNISETLLEVIPKIITTEDQAMLDVVPAMEEIKQTIFEMDPDSSPGPDGFSGSFYRACWKIIQDDVVNAVQFCWKKIFIPKGLNSNFFVLLPKVEGARSPQQYRPIGLSNVSFKIFTKIITSRMSILMHKLISPQQASYIKGRNIQDQIILASEMVNEMKKKIRNGNIGLKLDIAQAYDSVSWKFLFQVLKKYGFSDTWCEWLGILFESARISVMINGGPNDFFSVGRGLRQGDPISPILFVLMEDVLSRNITKLVMEDDVFIFCSGAKKSIQNLLKLLEEYQDSSGQVIDRRKSKPFVDGTTTARMMQIKEMMQMEVSSLLDKYLGVILHSGRIKIATVWPIVEIMQKKLASWKEVGFTEYVKEHINLKVSDLIVEGKWNLPEELNQILAHYNLPAIGVGDDILIWKGEIKGLAGFGVVIRDHLSQVLGVITGGIGITTNYIAEVYAIISAVELAVEWKVHNVILNSDSKTVITKFENNKMPWFVKMRWQKEIRHIQSIIFLHSYRETNFATDTAAKKGARLAAGKRQVYYGRPNFLARVEQPNVEYYRIC
ncbi:uncharacterized protein LOC113295646 [Papaver somniferum]|uniref:uncharacterized protein LOC113295646 n=1 Tax=Papaver somniferum TaxID=3469 RepID=UPI000E6FD0C6|nr:uncharacterized protein LOC113295646 [Papaver somniferum]